MFTLNRSGALIFYTGNVLSNYHDVGNKCPPVLELVERTALAGCFDRLSNRDGGK